MAYKKKISIRDFKLGKYSYVWSSVHQKYEPAYGYDLVNIPNRSVSNDLMYSNYYISGVVTAHFTFPIHPMDQNYGRWNRYDIFCGYSDTRTTGIPYFNGSGDILFIEDNTSGIAVIGTQFYGKSYIDGNNPPNVDTAYIPHRYHINVGDTIDIYSGKLIHVNRFNESKDLAGSGYISYYSKRFLSLINSHCAYTVIPNEKYFSNEPISNTNKIIDDIYDKNIRISYNSVKPQRTSIPLIGIETEGKLVQINNVKFSSSLRKKTTNKSDFFRFEPGKLYTVVDRNGNEIDVRICHGTEMARFFTKTSFTKEFNLIGICAGTDSYGYYEIWPRTSYDLGKSLPRNDTNMVEVNINQSS